MTEIWSDDDRSRPRGYYVLPCLLRHTESEVYLKAVLLDLSATGFRVFTNDRRVRLMDPNKLIGKTFHVEFDFHELTTEGLIAKVVNVHPGKFPDEERQLGLQFTTITPDVAATISKLTTRDRAAEAERKSREL